MNQKRVDRISAANKRRVRRREDIGREVNTALELLRLNRR